MARGQECLSQQALVVQNEGQHSKFSLSKRTNQLLRVGITRILGPPTSLSLEHSDPEPKWPIGDRKDDVNYNLCLDFDGSMR